MESIPIQKKILNPEQYEHILSQEKILLFYLDGDSILFSGPWQSLLGHFPPSETDIHPDDFSVLSFCHEMLTANGQFSAELRLRQIDGDFIWYRLHCHKNSNISGSLICCQQEKLLQDQIDKDALTGLLNQCAGRRKAEQLLQDSPSCSLFLLDLDDFKKVNDTYGHLMGDEVLALAGQVLCDCFPDAPVIARMGGDEFMILLPEALCMEELQQHCLQLQSRMARLSTPLRCSVGIAITEQGKHSYIDLFNLADRALYQVKKNGKNGFCLANSMDGTQPFPR